MKWIETTQPASEPVTYAEAKAQIHLDDDEEQTYVEGLIKVARRYAERVLSQCLVNRTVVATFYDSTTWVGLPRGPVPAANRITSVEDRDGNAVTVYEVRRIGNQDGLYFSNAPSFPLTVTYTAGYGDADDVPEDTKHAMLMHIAHLFRKREAVTDKAEHHVAHGLEAIYGMTAAGDMIG